MSVLIVTPPPWATGQELQASNGDTYLATGANMAKPVCEYVLIEGPPGDQGPVGDQGAPGTPGDNGINGFSPSVSCSVSDNVLTIEIDNAAGTTQKVLDVCPDGNAGG